METKSPRNKKIVFNTFFLYIRMLFTMVVTLFTSRVILATLGVEDFGINNVVGGLAISFIFFRSSLANATQRFLNFEMGRNNESELRNICNQSILVYTVIAIIIFILLELIGIWFLENKLTLPTNRLSAAYWVFQFTSIGLCLTLISTTYDAVLIARENMKVYAYIGIIEAILKLIIVYMLYYIDYDKLITYSFLYWLVTILSRSIFPMMYCIKKFDECKLAFYFNKKLFNNMLKFTSWNTVGSISYMINEQGINIILNIFFGPIINASRAISQQVGGAINNFITNFSTAIRPQIIKSYAANDYNYFHTLIIKSSTYSFYLFLIISLPLIFKTEYVLKIWLGMVPDQSTDFVKWILYYNLINVLTYPVWTGVQATGNLKNYIVYSNLIFILAFPTIYLLLSLGYNALISFQVLTIFRFLYHCTGLYIFKKLTSFSLKKYCRQVFIPIIIVGAICYISSYYIAHTFDSSAISFIKFCFISFLINTFLIYIFGISNEDKAYIKKKLITR